MDSRTKTREERPSLDILLVENDPGMVALTKIAFEEAGLRESVTSVQDGEEALGFLKNEENHQKHSHPHLIFLDLHLPKMSGLEVLEEIKANPAWMTTPVVVVSGHTNPAEIRRAYELHASCCIRKPDDLDELLRFAKVSFAFWGDFVALPEM